MTKPVASPIPRALSRRLETPMKGHRPRNFTSTTLLTRAVVMMRTRYSVMTRAPCSRRGRFRATTAGHTGTAARAAPEWGFPASRRTLPAHGESVASPTRWGNGDRIPSRSARRPWPPGVAWIVQNKRMKEKSAPDILPRVFQQAVEQADMAISITDPRANILYVNPAFTRVTGYSAAEVAGRNQSILSNRTTPTAIYEALWQKISRGEAWSGRLVNRRRDGGKYLAEVLITPVIDGAGAVTHYLGLHRDITELYELECQVRNDKALIESALEAAPVVLALLDEEERVVLDNHEYKNLMADLGIAEPAKVILEAVRNGEGRGFGPPREGAAAFADREVRIDRPGG